MPCHDDPPSLLQERQVILLPLTQGYSTAFHPLCSAQGVKQLHQSSSGTYPNPSLDLSFFLRLHVFIITTRKQQCFEKELSPEITHFLTKRTQYPPAFCLLKCQSRGSRKLGFMYYPSNNLCQIRWRFKGKRKTILALSNLEGKKWSI